MTTAFHLFAETVATRAVQSLAEGALIVLFASVVLRFSRQSAGTRFAVWFSSLVAIAVLPILGGKWFVHSAPYYSAGHATFTVPDRWAVYLLAVWAITAVWFLFGVIRAAWHLHTLRKGCTPIEPTLLDPLLQDTLDRYSAQRNVSVCTSARVRVPAAIGLLKPAVVIPEWVMRELSTDEINQILVHELAHLRRWDDWTNLAQQVVKAIFFFHPAVWWVDKKAALERESACDDIVLAEAASPRAYAECLTRLAEKSFLQRSVVLAQAALGRIRQMSLRVSRILDPNREPSQKRGWKPVASLVAVFAAGTAISISRAPQLIAFENDAPVQVDSGITAISSQPANVVSSRMDAAKAYRPAAGTQQKPVIIPAKLNLSTVPATPLKAKQSPKRHLKLKAQPEATVRFTNGASEHVPVMQTVFVVIESERTDAANYQIQMWHVTVLRTPMNAAAVQVPHKEI
jgi:beta-lactamase regulating signal transducer with metallopeptidase domain